MVAVTLFGSTTINYQSNRPHGACSRKTHNSTCNYLNEVIFKIVKFAPTRGRSTCNFVVAQKLKRLGINCSQFTTILIRENFEAPIKFIPEAYRFENVIMENR